MFHITAPTWCSSGSAATFSK